MTKKSETTNATAPAKRVRKTSESKVKLAEGAVAVSIPTLAPTKVTPENVHGFLSNIHLADAVNNLTRQIYSSEPELWITDENGETVEEATKWLKDEFDRLGCWNLMRYVIPDTYQWGCFVYSVGIEATANGGYRISEIRHLPAESFNVIPPTYSSSKIIPNPLMPGIIIDEEGNVEAWQTNRANGQRTLIQNVRFVRATGTPGPSGAAFLYPCYFLISRMDFAAQAQIQQVARVGAPRLMPKVKDDVTTEDYKNLETWYNRMGKFWNGKDNALLIPPGIEFPTLNIKEGTVAQDFINQAVDWIRTYCNPMSDLTSANGLGTSDSGRMEMWANFIASEQTLAEHWLEELFAYILEANGRTGYQVHIGLKRPSIDRSAVKLQALSQAVSAGAITPEEIRDNLTDVLELKEWSPEIESQLRTLKAVAYPMFNKENGEPVQPDETKNYTKKEKAIMQTTADALSDVHDQMAEAIAKVLEHGN